VRVGRGQDGPVTERLCVRACVLVCVCLLYRMNLSLRDVVCTSRDGDKFWKIPECYIRGNNIKYLRVPDEVIDKVVEEPKSTSLPNPKP